VAFSCCSIHELTAIVCVCVCVRHFRAADEYTYVSQIYFRLVRHAMRPNETVFYDNGHHTLLFMNGLLKFLTDTGAAYKVCLCLR
jgi:hypothetical protein